MAWPVIVSPPGAPGAFGAKPSSAWTVKADTQNRLLGETYTFDARNNTPRIGRVLMARGRDACDVALASTFGPNTLQSFQVWSDEVMPY